MVSPSPPTSILPPLPSISLCLLLIFSRSLSPRHLRLSPLRLRLYLLLLGCFAPSLLSQPSRSSPTPLSVARLHSLPPSLFSLSPSLSLYPDEIFMPIHTGSVAAAAAAGATGVNAFKDFGPLSFAEREKERGRERERWWWGRKRGSRRKTRGEVKTEESR